MKKSVYSVLFGLVLSTTAFGDVYVKNGSNKYVGILIEAASGSVQLSPTVDPYSKAFINNTALLYKASVCFYGNSDSTEPLDPCTPCVFKTPSPAIINITSSQDVICLPLPQSK